MIILSVDYGKVRTGIAVSDKNEILALPVRVIEERNQDKLVKSIADIAKDLKAERIVIGLPRNMDGSEGESAKSARILGEKINNETKLDVIMSDERGTTITAHNYLNNTDTRGKKRKKVIDTVSAVIILQDYLDFRKNNG